MRAHVCDTEPARSGGVVPEGSVQSPEFSVVIPHADSYPRYSVCLRSVLSDLPPAAEMILVGDGVGPEESAYLSVLPLRALRHSVRKGAAFSRNRGARVSRGEWLLFLDADVAVPAGFFKRFFGRLRGLPPRCVLQAIYSLETPAQNIWMRYRNLYYRYVYKERIIPDDAPAISGHCFAVRRREFMSLGGFDTRIPAATAEDTDLALRARLSGFRIVLDTALEVVHHKRYSAEQLIKAHFELSRGKAKFFLRKARDGVKRPELLTISGAGLGETKDILASVFLSPFVLLLAPVRPMWSLLILSIIIILNMRFFRFVKKQAGWRMALVAAAVRWPDHLASFAGALCGFLGFLAGKRY